MEHPLPGTGVDRSVVAILGPTGSGKSTLAVRLAEIFNGEVLNCDSVQIYRFFDVGTAKISDSERHGIPHHLIDIAAPSDVFTAGDYSRAGRLVLQEIARRSRLPIVAGGTGFYLRALLEGLAPCPPRNDALRGRLAGREERRPGSLHRLLLRFDPLTAARIHARDISKVIRALEIRLSTRRSAAELSSDSREALTGFRVLKIGLSPNRESLYQRLEARVDKMFKGGLIEEVAAIRARGIPETAKPFESIGYKQALQVIRGDLSLKDALFYTKRDTRRYAKRQMTWFRQEPEIRIVSGFGDDPGVAGQVEECIRAFLNGW